MEIREKVGKILSFLRLSIYKMMVFYGSIYQIPRSMIFQMAEILFLQMQTKYLPLVCVL